MGQPPASSIDLERTNSGDFVLRPHWVLRAAGASFAVGVISRHAQLALAGEIADLVAAAGWLIAALLAAGLTNHECILVSGDDIVIRRLFVHLRAPRASLWSAHSSGGRGNLPILRFAPGTHIEARWFGRWPASPVTGQQVTISTLPAIPPRRVAQAFGLSYSSDAEPLSEVWPLTRREWIPLIVLAATAIAYAVLLLV